MGLLGFTSLPDRVVGQETSLRWPKHIWRYLMQVRRGIIALALLSALTVTGVGLINSSPGAPARPVAEGGCQDSHGNVVPVGTTAQGSDGHTYVCVDGTDSMLFGIDYWMDMGLTNPSGGGGKHQPLQA
jgi:hypothetical protein